MKLFLKRSRGSITVFVSLIMIPTIFFTGFLVDLSRLKLYGNQAVMTADNYGDTILSQYDNLLKELYGLFAVTQDEEAIKQLDNLQKYVKSSFDPSSNVVAWNHFEAVQGLIGTSGYDGFMPYQSANVILTREFVDGANLGNHEVLSTQIGDFMRFRIAQQLMGDGSDILEALNEVQNMENNAKAIDKKLEIDEKSQKIFEAAKDYYDELKKFTQYPGYIDGVNISYETCKTAFTEIAESDSYKTYYDYETCNKEAMNAAVEKRDRIESQEEDETEEGEEERDGEDGDEGGGETKESLSEEEQRLVDIYDAYQEDSNARKDKLKLRFETAIQGIRNSADVEPINVKNYENILSKLNTHAQKIKRLGSDLKSLREKLEEILNDENITEELRDGVRVDLERMNELFDQIGYYTDIVTYIDDNNTIVNSEYEQQITDILSVMEKVENKYLNCEEDDVERPDKLQADKWKKFDSNTNYKALYESLDKCFGNEGAEEEGKKKKDAAKDLQKQSAEEISKDETTSARDIPADFGYGTSYRGGGFELAKMVNEAVECFATNNFKNEGNKLLLKLYTVEYDFGMFSSRVTNIKKEDEPNETEVSLTGYEKSAAINYLYQAELEYILGGSNSSKENLGEARNKILAIRSIVNFTATYSVEEVNTAIQSISDAAAAVNPILGLVVNGALRLAVAGAETAMDWSDLKDGKSVVLIKNTPQQMTAWTKFKDLLNLKSDKPSGEGTGIKLDYEQYLMIMMVFLTSSDTIAERTANLIELNVNAAEQKIGENGSLSELKFKMADAHTAVNATCAVHLDFVIMPMGFAQAAVSDETYGSITNFQKNSYKFTVTRGY